MREIEDYLKEQLERREKALINTLSYVGEACVNEARIGGRYKDRTGNLRSSIGYVLVKEGRVILQSSFEQVKKGAKGTRGGEAFAKRLVSKFPTGICLIVVAGMNYASYVSAVGLNVLDSSEDLAERLVPQMLKQLVFD